MTTPASTRPTKAQFQSLLHQGTVTTFVRYLGPQVTLLFIFLLMAIHYFVIAKPMQKEMTSFIAECPEFK